MAILRPNATHLGLGLAGRTSILPNGAIDCRDYIGIHLNTGVPGGWMTVPLDGRVAEGRFLSNRPIRDRLGAIRDLGWTFHADHLVEHEAGEGADSFESHCWKGGWTRTPLGLLVVGPNPSIRDFPVAEDQERGVISPVIQRNADYWSRTRRRFRQYAVLREADLYPLADDERVLRAGRRP